MATTDGNRNSNLTASGSGLRAVCVFAKFIHAVSLSLFFIRYLPNGFYQYGFLRCHAGPEDSTLNTSGVQIIKRSALLI